MNVVIIEVLFVPSHDWYDFWNVPQSQPPPRVKGHSMSPNVTARVAIVTAEHADVCHNVS